MATKKSAARYVVVRAHLAGVHFGKLAGEDGDKITLHNARRAYSWQGALTVSELATTGPKKGSRICVKVSRVVIFGATEMVDATEGAAKAWMLAPDAS